MVRLTPVVVASLLVAACATSHVTGFRDPGYGSARFDHLAVFALGMTLGATVAVERVV